jgi:hypothetical protein
MNNNQPNNADYQMDYISNSTANNSSPPAITSSQLPEMSQKLANPVTAEFLRDQTKLHNKDADDDCSTQSAEALFKIFHKLDKETDDDQPDQPEDYDNDIVGNSIYPTSQGDPGYVNSTGNTMVLDNSSEMSDGLSTPNTPKIRTQYLPDPFPPDATFNWICLKDIHHPLIFQYCSNVAFHVHKIPGLVTHKYPDKYTIIVQCRCSKYRIKTISTNRNLADKDRTFCIDPTYGIKAIP